MRNKQTRLRMALSWLAPSVSELVIYIFLSIVTLIVSNVSFVRDFIFVPQYFNFRDLVLGSVNSLLDRFIGVGATRSAVVIIFWALVGLLVYALIWVLTSFSDELGNDLALTKYVHPRNVDTSSPLRQFLKRTIFRVMVLIVFVFYISAFWKAILPFSMQQYRIALDTWPKFASFKAGFIGMLVEVIALHAFVVFARLLFLKKRIFE